MGITKVWIDEGCTVCNLCEDTAPDVFEVTDDTCIIKEGADLAANEDEIRESVEACPVEVIIIEED
ncbi:MAG: ferredoxin [Candidatus Krumholzibacteria bacterium]|nr:ferredoxin [Candidatus Krumholzibacteria bacterium]MDP6669398.1 ferredoxin [Candidatus Krumholzibacteria bacterium]MDP6797958.1 ferredoxin [Candidatus Krumholzibacteria bacterium]MDP7021887.1 ferredoxin [Candidatus Krumholzibacteria bacterium]